MFTVKAYKGDNVRLYEADSITILRSVDCYPEESEITLHRVIGEDLRIDVKEDKPVEPIWPSRFDKVIIENSAGKTTEIVRYMPSPDKYDPRHDPRGPDDRPRKSA